jgi:cation:H+ antiporter
MVVAGLAVALWASRRVVNHASALAFGLNVPPFLIGITLLALGTDLPEIANSIAASLSDHGDLNVGDSVGSAVTQMTLVLGLLPFIGGGAFHVRRDRILLPGLTIAGALALTAILLRDGWFSRTDAVMLLTTWVVMSFLIWRRAPQAAEPAMAVESPRKGYHAVMVLATLVAVGAGATVAIRGVIELAEILDVPEYIIAFFGTSIGTSLPELVVGGTAIREQERDLAVGDVFGSSLLDATLSIGAGPLIAPTAITASLAVAGSLWGVVAILLITAILFYLQRHGRITGVALIGMYAAFYPLVLMVEP